MADIAELLARVEAATEGDRRLDAVIAAILNVRLDWAATMRGELVPNENGRVSVGKSGPGWEVERYSSSIDAAVALVEKVLPAAEIVTHRYVSGRGAAKVYREAIERADLEIYTEAHAASVPLAILAALFRALPLPVHPQGS